MADYEGLEYYAANYLGGYSHIGEANLIYPDNFGYHDYGEGSINWTVDRTSDLKKSEAAPGNFRYYCGDLSFLRETWSFLLVVHGILRPVAQDEI